MIIFRLLEKTNVQSSTNTGSLNHTFYLQDLSHIPRPHYPTLLKDILTINPRKATGPDFFFFPEISSGAVNPSLEASNHYLNFALCIPGCPPCGRHHECTLFIRKNKSNYRPLQVLRIPSKILKATVCRNIDNFINENGLSNKNHWGLIKGRSTEGLLTHLKEKWKIALDNGNVVGVVFIDFKKAFDCVSHSILYLKLQALGFLSLIHI